MRWIFVTCIGLLALPLTGRAQDRAETLADVRQEMSVLYVEVQRLKRELSTTGASGGLSQGGSALVRIDAIERELQRLTGKTEELEFRINRVVTDGTNRIGDLEFRLVELEGGDVSKLGQTTTLGGGTAAPAPAAPIVPNAETEMAVGEKADFERAEGVLASGDFRAAADLFATFGETYPGGPLTALAHLKRGEALAQLDDQTGSARAYLEAFSSDPKGEHAPDALFRLGRALGGLGQTSEACVTLGEVGARFPASAVVEQAEAERARLSCS
ncbi:tol-pal system protein YbgF [Thalassovita taeanensis]|uniref:Cell division coordinator CpoB n=1 Tax=Thalassovita taeanensis TaxID=657014 RepID=A0A1H9ACE0_9RHOB|nr:tol-pal system protein YbgF [Thalassovita taeanensis]SEP74422.1 tol-pal system protein YbgF [Thalassovita taeanensis]